MSVMGQERTSAALDFMSVVGGKADVKREKADIGDFMSAFDPIMSVIAPKADIPNSTIDVRY